MSDVNLHDVLCMPPELWGDDDLDKRQRYSRYLDASRRIEEDERKIAAAHQLIREMREALVCLIAATLKDETGFVCTSDIEAASYVANAAIAQADALLAGTERKCETCNYSVTDSECPPEDPCCGSHNGYYKWIPAEEIAR